MALVGFRTESNLPVQVVILLQNVETILYVGIMAALFTV